MMHKSSKIFKIIFLALSTCIGALLVYALICAKSVGIRDGKYYIVNCDKYPDAYIQISKNKIRMYNIDLNDLYQKAELSAYYDLVEGGHLEALSEEQLKYASDLNEMFVNNEWLIDYEGKKGFYNIWFLYRPNTHFGVLIRYDKWKGEIQINDIERKHLRFKWKLF